MRNRENQINYNNRYYLNLKEKNKRTKKRSVLKHETWNSKDDADR